MTAPRDDRVRPRRSVLYLPGVNQRALDKATSLPADALILDLEDAVAPDAKSAARERVAVAASDDRYASREVAVRANGLATPWFEDDLAAIAEAGPQAVLVPKVGSAADVLAIGAALERHRAPDHTRIWAMLETPAAVLHAEAIVTASERLAVVVMGTNDLVKELRATRVPGRAPLLAALSWCVLAARHAGVAILDGVHNELADAEGFEAECRQGAELGFDGKTLIHPKQLATCNRVFAPSKEDLARAHEIIAAHATAMAESRAVVTVHGRLVEQLHVDEARRLLARAEAIAELHHGDTTPP